jgi:hypothetical protein
VHGVDDEVMVGDGVANVDEGVREALEVATKVVNGEVTLLHIVKVLQSIDNMLHGVVDTSGAKCWPTGAAPPPPCYVLINEDPGM